MPRPTPAHPRPPFPRAALGTATLVPASCCCGGGPSYTTLGPSAEEQCLVAGGALVTDPAPCASVCCALGGETGPDAGPLEVMAQGACDAAGGVAVGGAALCASTCCHGPGLEHNTQPAYTCLMAGGTPTTQGAGPADCGACVCDEKCQVVPILKRRTEPRRIDVRARCVHATRRSSSATSSGCGDAHGACSGRRGDGRLFRMGTK